MAYAEPSLVGQSGLVHMPDARIAEDGTLRFGVAHEDPYLSFWGSVTLFPRLELSGRYIRIDGVPGFPDAPELGDYRDKALDAKAVLVAESSSFPAVAIGVQDFVGTQLFASRYLVLSKRVGSFDFTAGYGQDRIDGAFGGVRYTPDRFAGLSLLIEYDANDYASDHGALQSGAGERRGGVTYGLAYRWGWLGGQVSYQSGDIGANAYVSIPLMQPEFIPKLDEPPPYAARVDCAPIVDWRKDPQYEVALARTLEQQGFRDVKVRLRDAELEAGLTHGRISAIGRAVGRAARTLLLLGPCDLRALRIIYTQSDLPLVDYEFRDLRVLDDYLGGRIGRAEFDRTVAIRFPSTEAAVQLREAIEIGPDVVETLPPIQTDRFIAAKRREDRFAGFDLLPFNVRLFFNDPGEPVRYDTFALLAYDRRIATGTYLKGAARATLFENVSDIRQPSTSLLPHVRSDIGEYRREGKRVRLNTLLLNRYALLAERWYGRMSGGYYEEMFAGFGGQALYLPRSGFWAADLAVDRVRQRELGESFGFRDYRVTTAIASLHYRLPRYGVTTTARTGRFLARDEGIRLELKRRFRSGVEVGAWYTWTNEKDITNPGTPENPYRDKGLFVVVPLNSMLTRDTQEIASMAIADYVRDVGQMVVSPGDLYRMVERPLGFGVEHEDRLSQFTR